MVYIRGQAEDFEHWQALGNPGWGWADVLPYFRKSECNALGADTYRGADGPLHVADVSSEVHPLCDVYISAGKEAGLPFNPDFNGVSQEGVGLYQITTRNGRRMSAARAFLRPAMGRSNLRVETGAQVSRVEFHGTRAVAVRYRQHGNHHRVKAGREVIIAAGSIGSPQLLQLSGVGPVRVLKSLGIEMVLDSPAVGENLLDHLGADYLYRSRKPTLNNELRPWWGKLKAGLRYVLRRRGPLSLSVNQGGGFLRTRPGLERPNIQLYFSPVSYIKAPPGKRPLMSPDPYPGFLLGISQCRPTSSGHIRIRSCDPSEHPRICPNYLSTEHDVREMLEGVRFLRRLAATPSMAALIEEELQPGSDIQSEEELIEDIRQRAWTVFHPVSTCRMGPDPKQAVVNHRLRVHCLAGLRIIDASVFPSITSGNTNAPSIMVREKGADIILEDARAGD